jgi:hypothetical protein
MQVHESPCPECDAAPPVLKLTMPLVANPIGTFSVSGRQMKVTARTRPQITCSACGAQWTGEFDGDRHAVFNREPDVPE